MLRRAFHVEAAETGVGVAEPGVGMCHTGHRKGVIHNAELAQLRAVLRQTVADKVLRLLERGERREREVEIDVMELQCRDEGEEEGKAVRLSEPRIVENKPAECGHGR